MFLRAGVQLPLLILKNCGNLKPVATLPNKIIAQAGFPLMLQAVQHSGKQQQLQQLLPLIKQLYSSFFCFFLFFFFFFFFFRL